MARVAVLKLVVIAVCVLASACSETPPLVVRGDAENGRLLLRQFGCGSCHRIPGVAAAEGNVGPPLDAIARRVYLAGLVPPSWLTKILRQSAFPLFALAVLPIVLSTLGLPELGAGEALGALVVGGLVPYL